MRGIATLLAAVLLIGAGCGKYGPPVRRSPTGPPTAEAPATVAQPEENTRDEERETTP